MKKVPSKYNSKTSSSGLGRPKDEAKHAAILEAAGCLFLDRGMAGTTMDAIARKAGVSKLTVYNHFGTKEELFFRIICDKCEGHTGDHIFDHLSGEDPYAELVRVGQGFVSLVYSPDAIAMNRVIISEGPNHPEMAALFFEAGPESLKGRFVRYLEKVERHGTYSFPDKYVATSHFFCLFKGEPHLRALLNVQPLATSEDLDKLVRDCVAFFLSAYRMPS